MLTAVKILLRYICTGILLSPVRLKASKANCQYHRQIKVKICVRTRTVVDVISDILIPDIEYII